MQSPYDLYGPLLAAVQTRGIFDDGKTFVDARPKRPVAAILHDFAALEPLDEAGLLAFVHANFSLPMVEADPWVGGQSTDLESHIRATWKHLARGPKVHVSGCSGISINHPHIVPGGRFRELYYWDSFFSMLGLIHDDEITLASGMVDAMTDLIERYGHVPNGTRSYYIGRSQPPFYHMMVSLVAGREPHQSERRLKAMKAEHAWWMSGERNTAPGECCKRAVRLADGSLLNRYWDPRSTPRDESWGEDIDTAALSDRPQEEVFRDLRAGAESGWDFSSRWQDGTDLSSIRTTSIIPIDLNAFLYSLEVAIANGGDHDASLFRERAKKRLLAMHTHCWSPQDGCFVDTDLSTLEPRRPTAASFAPLLCRLATPQQAASTARIAKDQLIAPGGLRTTLVETGQQWDMPNGWAPLQWVAIQGLLNYGYSELAEEIARRWISTVSEVYRQTGFTHEKYDIEACSIGAGGEYDPQVGFGWTNGVTLDLIRRFSVPSIGRETAMPLTSTGKIDKKALHDTCRAVLSDRLDGDK